MSDTTAAAEERVAIAGPDGKFRFKPDWENTPAPNKPPAKLGSLGPIKALPGYPDQVDLIETADAEHPFRLATSPARNFLNSTFAETKTSRDKEGRPEVMVNSADALSLGLADGDVVQLGNARGELRIHAKITEAVKPGVQEIDTRRLPGGIYDVVLRVIEDGQEASRETASIHKPSRWRDPTRRWRYSAFAGQPERTVAIVPVTAWAMRVSARVIAPTSSPRRAATASAASPARSRVKSPDA